jgi:hypothetical protein
MRLFFRRPLAKHLHDVVVDQRLSFKGDSQFEHATPPVDVNVIECVFVDLIMYARNACRS